MAAALETVNFAIPAEVGGAELLTEPSTDERCALDGLGHIINGQEFPGWDFPCKLDTTGGDCVDMRCKKANRCLWGKI